jgi:uncharacterized protein Yka (UPF0111/DUF47 family)
MNDSTKENGKLRNFDLTIDEIKLVKAIDLMTKTVEKLEKLDPRSQRAKSIRLEIKKLEDQLDELRENTLIR